MFGHHKLLREGAQIEGVVLKNGSANNITKDRLTIGVKFDDGETVEFTEDLTNYFEPPAHTLSEFAENLTSTNVIPLSPISGSTIPVRYDPGDRRRLAIDVPAFQEQVLQQWTAAQAADRSRAEAVLAAQTPGGQPSADGPGGPSGAGEADADKLEAEVESLMKLADLHQSGGLSDEEYAAAKRKLLAE